MNSLLSYFDDVLSSIESRDFKLFVFNDNQFLWVKLFLILMISVPLYMFAMTTLLLYINSLHSDNLYQISLLLQQNGTLLTPSPPLPTM